MVTQDEGTVPAGNPVPAEQIGIEARSIWVGLASAAVAAFVGVIAFRGYRPPLAGDASIALYAALLGGGAAATGCVLGYSTMLGVKDGWLGARPLYRRLTDHAALAVMHGSIAVMAALGIFRVFQDAFFGLTVDWMAGSVMIALTAGIAGYLGYNSGARISAATLSVLLAAFMGAGMLVSMLFAENPLWWHSMFSELGTGTAGLTSFWTFNTTITVSGLLLTTLTSFIVRDLVGYAQLRQRAAAAAGLRRVLLPRPKVVRACLIGTGLCMVGIGLVPISVAEPVHTAFVRVAAGFLLVLLLGVPLWLPGFPKAFVLLSLLAVVGIAGATVLWHPLHYYNVTALELAVSGIVFAWLVVFIRNTSAMVQLLQGHGDAGNVPAPEGRV
ncbi:hypothetical protein GCM10023166_08010 [Paeniglutamicibacter cryotolerans]|uniref:DUF998 domain-containing protein n=2 Tax=Paeniglutamicibacter cryotolerans TaxID=670079 RepID=A0A839QJB3_9MICC|nr:hypothetical protein [Paeniglutamicibacter cryotolerans]MBB2994824.1 hypothetical protein [Paeniglutamicibacter cryotolerans]